MMLSTNHASANSRRRSLLLASGEWAASSGGRIPADWQIEKWRRQTYLSDFPGTPLPRIELVQVAPWRPETVVPRHLPLLACRQPAPAWMAAPLHPWRHKPAEIRAGAPMWPSRLAALRAAVAGFIVEARRRYRRPGNQLHTGIGRRKCCWIIAWARHLAGCPAKPRGYEALEPPAAEPQTSDGEASEQSPAVLQPPEEKALRQPPSEPQAARGKASEQPPEEPQVPEEEVPEKPPAMERDGQMRLFEFAVAD